MRILWLDEVGNLPAHRPIIDKIQWAGFPVDLLIADHRVVGQHWELYKAQSTLSTYIGYDLIISATHDGNPHVSGFLDRVAKPHSVVSIEHDPFRDAVETCPKPLSKHVLAFTSRAEKYLSTRGYTYKRAQWSKTEIPTGPITTDARPNEDAVVFTDPQWKLPESDIFRKVWVKDFLGCYNAKGPNVLKGAFKTAKGSAYLPQIARFWLLSETSAYIDALVFGCIPILHNATIIREDRHNDIVSKVRLRKKSSREVFDLLAVTATNLKDKIKALQNNPKNYEDTLTILRGDWFPKDYEQWPLASDVVLDTVLEHALGSSNRVGAARSVIRLYHSELSRAPDKAGLLHWAASGSEDDILRTIRSSKEYQIKHPK